MLEIFIFFVFGFVVVLVLVKGFVLLGKCMFCCGIIFILVLLGLMNVLGMKMDCWVY